MAQYWRAGKNYEEIWRNEGEDGEGRVPVKRLQKQWPDGGIIFIWPSNYDEEDPKKSISWGDCE